MWGLEVEVETMRRTTTGSLGTAGYAVAVVLLIAMILLVRAYLARVEALTVSVRHTDDVIQRLNDAMSDLLDLRTAQRAFVATGNRAYLAEYEEAAKGVPESYEQANALRADDQNLFARSAAWKVISAQAM
jgi:CHASE3 domain sensor protein